MCTDESFCNRSSGCNCYRPNCVQHSELSHTYHVIVVRPLQLVNYVVFLHAPRLTHGGLCVRLRNGRLEACSRQGPIAIFAVTLITLQLSLFENVFAIAMVKCNACNHKHFVREQKHTPCHGAKPIVARMTLAFWSWARRLLCCPTQCGCYFWPHCGVRASANFGP